MDKQPHPLWADWFRKKSLKQTTMLDLLRENVLFKTLDSRELLYLSSMVYERHYEANEAVFKQGDQGFGMYIIASGRIAIHNSTKLPTELVTYLDAGSFFGELALVDPENLRSAHAVATEAATLYGFFKSDLMEIIERKPAMGAKILFQLSYVIGQRLIETTEILSETLRERLPKSE